MSTYQVTNVLILVDGSETSSSALCSGLAICQATGAIVTALAVYKPPEDASEPGSLAPPSGSSRELLLAALDNAHRQAESWNVPVTTFLTEGDAERVVPDYAKDRDHDLIVLPLRNDVPTRASHADAIWRIVADAHCPVMIARAAVSRPGRGLALS